MNNKGMTLIELLVTFSLLMIIVVGMYSLILDTRLDLDNKQIIKDYTEYSNTINRTIQDDLIKRAPIAIAIKKTENSSWACHNSSLYFKDDFCTISNDNMFKIDVALINLPYVSHDIQISGSISLDSNTGKDICSNIYPCIVYAYYDKADVVSSEDNARLFPKFQVIALNYPNNLKKLNENNDEYGINYGNTFEPFPNQSYIRKGDSSPTIDINTFEDKSSDKKVFLSNLIINVPIYLSSDDKNYGFRVVHPLYSVNNSNENLE